jgi:hypothetical protein
LKKPFAALAAMHQALANEPDAADERAFVAEAMNACEAYRVRAAMDPGPGYFRPINPKRSTAVIEFYEQTALGMYHGFARRMSVYARRGDARQKRLAAQFARIPEAPPFPESGTPVRHAAVGKGVTLHTACSESYPGDGPDSLTDGRLGQTNHTDVAWLGFQGDCVATIDCGEPVGLNELTASFLQSVAVGIFLPRQVEFWAGDDLANLRLLGTVEPITREQERGPLKETLRLNDLHPRARYVQMRAANLGEIPAGHPSAGAKAWLFCEEILVNPEP